jgi:hypothetical protein
MNAHRMISLLLVPLLGASCAHLTPPTTLPVDHTRTVEQLVLYSDFPLPKQHRLFDELTALRLHIADELNLPESSEPIHIYLFKNGRRYRAFMRKHCPDFAARRAIFVETDTRLEVYVHWSDRIGEDLRHEVSHGYLHASVSKLPLWVDEGLAEYFEIARSKNGLHEQHLQELKTQLAAGWQPDVERLSKLSDPAEMQQIDYAEAWAWIHFLMNTKPERRLALQEYLDTLRRRGKHDSLPEILRRLHFAPERGLVDHLKSLKSEL